MPLILSLAAPGSHCRFLRCRTRLPPTSQPYQYVSTRRTIVHARLQYLVAAQAHLRAHFPHHQNQTRRASGSYSHTNPRYPDGTRVGYASHNVLPEDDADPFASILGIDSAEEYADRIEGGGEGKREDGRFTPVLSRRTRKRRRLSQPAMVLDSIRNEARNLYWSPDPDKMDHSYINPAQRKQGGIVRRDSRAIPTKEIRHPIKGPVTLYTILSRQLHLFTESPWIETTFTRQEVVLLESKGYSKEDVQLWMSCLVTGHSIPASAVFKYDHRRTPLFLLLLYLRRSRIRAFALGTVMRHLAARLPAEPIEWSSLQILVIRLIRNARVVWPEAMPWITSLFCTEATRIYHQAKKNASYSSRYLPSLTKFCNSLLSLIALPMPEHPVFASHHQEKAQFLLLQFMANCEPALTVTRHGFQGVARNQLAHAKTAQEKEWARLKGPSWPPWKENRNAMDEDKGYMFAASRASRLLHRLYEAGYGERKWEEIAGVYAGWDTDLSPTIQTRTFLPQTSKNNSNLSEASLWTARIRTTRTRREAWACFLAYERSNRKPSPEVYLAMFEKLHFSEVKAQQPEDEESRRTETDRSSGTNLLPGDMKEVLPDPKSPLHLVYLSEPVPSYSQLYHRMWRKGVRPSGRLLAFLLDTVPDFSTCLSLLEESEHGFSGGVRMLLHGSLLSDTTRSPIPDYFLASFIRFLCRFGRFAQLPPEKPTQFAPEDHKLKLKLDQTYLIDYAHALLIHLRPKYRPPWTAYMQKVLYGHAKKKSAEIQYTIISELFNTISEVDIDPDDDQFQLLCAVSRYTAQAAYKGQLSADFTHRVLSSAPPLLRTNFQNLVGANVDPSFTSPSDSKADSFPPRVPSPAVFQAYVRALGFLRDYEGLFSFSSWLTTYHKEVTVRANAQHGGPQLLYRTLLALRAALEGTLDSKNVHDGAPQEILELVKAQIEGIEGWNWPSEEHVNTYVGRQASLRRPVQVPVPNVPTV